MPGTQRLPAAHAAPSRPALTDEPSPVTRPLGLSPFSATETAAAPLRLLAGTGGPNSL
ncbi:hypothetical protein JNUCC64_00295 [Streptomyces sp. JNUCC 64]